MRLASLAFAAVLGFAAPAEAAFDTWRFPGPPLPLKLDDVAFARADRRDAVVEAVRAIAVAHLRDSGLFRADAATGLTVDLRDVESAASAAPDGAGVGRAAILYRVTDRTGRVVFNDRIAATARVTVAEAVELRQSTVRAARYRAFARNLETFALRLHRTLSPAADAALRLDAVRLARPLETPERTADFADRVRAALDAQLPTADAAPPFDIAIESLSLAALPPPGPDRAAAEVRLGLALALPGGAPVWRGVAEAKATADRDRALGAGLSPLDAAIADAAQAALRGIAPEIAAAARETAAMAEAARGRRLPFRLDRLEADAATGDVLPRLRRWNVEGQPLAAVWSADGAPLTIRADAAEVRLAKTAPGAGVAEVTVAWTALDAAGRTVLATRTATRTPFSAADARLHGRDAGDWAVRVGLRDAWIGLIDALAALPPR